jgi:glutamyl-tRNA reductase
MKLFAVGLNHQTAPIDLRERLAFTTTQLPEALRTIAQLIHTQETAILSTCNRTEVYCAAHSITPLETTLIEWLAEHKQIPIAELRQHLYILPQQETVQHAFRVASGLDSMVLGEPQILGQMKQAARSAEEAGTLGHLLHQLFQRTFFVAKEVRSHTEIGAHSVSMASAAVKLAQRIFGNLNSRHVLLIGAGEMIQLCAAHFAAHTPSSITIANRSTTNAQALAQHYKAQVITLADIPDQLPNADIVISCTASTLPLIGLGMVERACKKRKHEPIFMLDLAVPRDIETEVARLSDVFLYTVDDLSHIVQEGKEHRAGAVEHAERIIDQHLKHFLDWITERSIVPNIQHLHQQADDIVHREQEHALRLLAKGSPPEEVIQLMAHRISAKFMHGPLQLLHQANPTERENMLKWLPKLFHIKNNDK